MAKASKLPSGNWRVNLYVGNINGKKVRKSITGRSKKEAELKAALYMTENHLDDVPMTVGEAVDKYIKDSSLALSPSTINGYKQIQRCYLSGIAPVMIDKITRDDLQKWVNYLAKNHSAKSVRNIYSLVRSVITQCRPNFNPVIKLPKQDAKPFSIPSDDDIQKMLDNSGERLRLCIMLGAFCGMRRGEICYIRYSDIKDGCIYIHGDVVKKPDKGWAEKNHAKTEKSNRVVRVPEFVLKAVGEGKPDDKIMPRVPDWITGEFGRLMKELNMPYHFHSLRHYFASTLIAQGVPKTYVQALGGWENGGALDRVYTHILQSSQSEYSDQVSRIFSSRFS